jgi:hypothetical protein
VTSTPVLGVILLDYEGYVGEELRCTPEDDVGLGWMPPGHFEHPRSWGCPVIYRVANGCTPEASEYASQDAFRGVSEAARALDGRVDLITADCAYTWFVREALDGIRTPALTSSLALLDLARAIGGEVAIISSSGRVLHRLSGTLAEGVRIIGMETKSEWGRYQYYSVDTNPPLDRGLMARQLLERLDEDFHMHGEPGAVVLECTGLPQFRDVVRQRYGGPILDIASFVQHLLDVPAGPQSLFPPELVAVAADSTG